MTSNSKPGAPKVSVQDAITMLRAIHTTINGLYADFGSAPMNRKKAVLAEMYTALSVHVQIEEDLLHPDVNAAMNDDFLGSNATVKHAGLTAQRDGGRPDYQTLDAKTKVLAEYVTYLFLVKDEQNEMFPEVKKRSMALGRPESRLAVRTRESLAARTRSVSDEA